MKRFSKFLFLIALVAAFLLVNFPAAKITLYGIVVILVLNRLYRQLVRRSLMFERKLETDRLFIGLGEETVLEVNHTLPFPVHFLTLSDTADINITSLRNFYYAFSVPEKETFVMRYALMGRKRGLYHIGPTRVKFEDLIGKKGFSLEIDTTADVVVFPPLHPVVNTDYKSLQPYGAIRNPLPVYEDPAVITGLREYHAGDEMKRVNWKVSARQNKLFVNTYQPSISSDAVFILNLRSADYAFRNREYYQEQAVEVAASLIHRFYLDKQKFSLRTALKIAGQEEMLKTPLNSSEVNFTTLLEKLALADFPEQTAFQTLLDPEKFHIPWGVNIYIITPGLDEASLAHLIRLKSLGHRIYLINVGPDLNRNLSLWHIGFSSYYVVFEGNVLNLKRL